MDPPRQEPVDDEVTQDLVDLLADCPAFVGVDRPRLVPLVRGATLVYVAEHSTVADLDGPFVVQRGALLVRDAGGRAVDLVAEGEYHRPAPGDTAEALHAALVLVLPPEAADLAWSAQPTQLTAAVSPTTPQVDLQTAPVRSLMSRELVTATVDETCRTVAERMRAHRVSSVVVLGRDEPGIVTDRDLRNRLVAAGGSPDDPVGPIATFPVRTVTASTPVFTALIEMLASGIHHLPVTDGGRLVGMVTSSDLLQLRLRSPLHLRKALDRATSVEECARALATLPDTVRALRAAGTTPAQVGEVLATVADRLVTRLVALASADLGPAPAAFAWLAFGSQARRESSLGSDQDSGLVLADGAGPDAGEWAARLAERVTAGMERCGYPRCGGGVMATEPRWRGELASWQQRITQWITTPAPEHLLGAEIAFDLRTVAGDLDAAALLAPTIDRARDSGIFLAHLAQQAVSRRPPLGFLGRLAVDRSGAHAGTFDLKRGALLPIVDLARLHTLARGGSEIATADRLRAAAAAGLLSQGLADTLVAGHELVLGVRLDTALERLAAGLPVDNRVDPGALPALVRSQLKETFKAVRTAQEAVEADYGLAGRP